MDINNNEIIDLCRKIKYSVYTLKYNRNKKKRKEIENKINENLSLIINSLVNREFENE